MLARDHPGGAFGASERHLTFGYWCGHNDERASLRKKLLKVETAKVGRSFDDLESRPKLPRSYINRPHLTVIALISGPRNTPLWDGSPRVSRFCSFKLPLLSDPSSRGDFLCMMSRQSVQPQRPLSLTEELEKLEQSITLTLQGKAAVNKQLHCHSPAIPL